MSLMVQPLTEAQKEHFRTTGWLKLSNCFTKEQAEWVTRDVWTRLGMDPNDKSTWKHRTNMPSHRTFDCSEFAPKAWAAICEVCGGEDRIAPDSKHWRDSLIVNLGSPEFEGQEQNPKDLDNWHVDGDFFVHYLDSAEQGLLVIPLFTDIVPGGGGTVICPEAIPKVAKHLYEHPDGVSPRMVPRGHPDFAAERNLNWFNSLAGSCGEFVEAVGQVGDVYLFHPLMLHSASRNQLRKLRIITNPPVSLREPHRFHRPDGSKFSLVEQATLRALGAESLPEWGITAPRERVIPERLKIQERMKQEELKRLQASA
ncbi:hypothetical protein GCG54_00007860 [Colletotrichum gloeosporioides]|uniref:Phytanoyl-CoA dioxygenase n=1 Tax=Colletotrichum gloeosporioides TaxID=474922 RepID=A0A8H4CHY5_COLGL|nr:uncharacterized protein GCG54_00007860 [Colletotrichum gloeosporioides]KAF3804067.1 hypothetical protein GCG54_00007860 [Colletotrichum gloeosporioides]